MIAYPRLDSTPAVYDYVEQMSGRRGQKRLLDGRAKSCFISGMALVVRPAGYSLWER